MIPKSGLGSFSSMQQGVVIAYLIYLRLDFPDEVPRERLARYPTLSRDALK
jgi:hypothetical protein